MAAAASGGGSAAAEPVICPTDFSRFAMFNPRAPLGFFAKCARGMGLMSSNVLSNNDALDRLGYDKVFGRYYHLYDMYMNRPEKHGTTAKIRAAFDTIESARKLAIENFKFKRENPTKEPEDMKPYFRTAMTKSSAIGDENKQLSDELVRFALFLGIMYDAEIRALKAKRGRVASELALPAVPTIDPSLQMRYNALKKNTRRRKNRRHATRRMRRRA